MNKSNNSEPKLSWPSERIPQGGLFHTPKVVYSKETADLIKLLMEESRMSMLMRKQINYHLRTGEPLPKPQPPRIVTPGPDPETLHMLRRSSVSKRKSLDKILQSGVYEMPRYRPSPSNRISVEQEKKLLQESMSGVPLSDTVLKAKRKPKEEIEVELSPQDLINELLEQIDERAEWLAEMEELGEGKKYRSEVRSQISQRLRKIKDLEAQIQEKDKESVSKAEEVN